MLPETPELLENKEVAAMMARLQGSAEAKNAIEFAHALG